MPAILIKNARLVNEGKTIESDLLAENGMIVKIAPSIDAPEAKLIDAKGKYLIPGVIDDQVHFREPGLTHKANIYSEAKAAVAGGITSFMEMPNTNPQTLTQELLEDKYQIAAGCSLANYSFFMGASNENLDEVLKTNPKNVAGIKVFMGSSTGNMLVDNKKTLETIFSQCDMLIATHCEDEGTVRQNTALYKEKYGEDIPIRCHPEIRSVEACYLSSSMAVELAKKYNTRLHILHISTGKETELFRNDIPLKEKRITAEACVHHLWFDDSFYDEKGTMIKWNPAVKSAEDKAKIWEALLSDKIDIIATDHAPHTLEEKQNSYLKAPSGGPLVQHALPAMMECVINKQLTIEKMVEKMCHAPADCFQIDRRGFLKEGYHADMVLIDPEKAWTVDKDNVLYHCGWSPFEGTTFHSQVTHTIVNGHVVYENGSFDESQKGQRILYNR